MGGGGVVNHMTHRYLTDFDRGGIWGHSRMLGGAQIPPEVTTSEKKKMFCLYKSGILFHLKRHTKNKLQNGTRIVKK